MAVIVEMVAGAGVAGTVYKCIHVPSGVKMAVKVMTVTGNREKDQQIFKDIQVSELKHHCRYIVTRSNTHFFSNC